MEREGESLSDVDSGQSWWTMEWDEEGESGEWSVEAWPSWWVEHDNRCSVELDDRAAATMRLSLPEGMMLVATVCGDPWPAVTDEERTWWVCAGAEDEVIVRSGQGRFLRSETQMAPGAGPWMDWPLSPDPGEGGRALVSGAHLLRWLEAGTCEFAANGIFGQTHGSGLYDAELHPDYKFVLSASLSAPAGWRTTLEMTAHQVVPREDVLLNATDVDAEVLRSHLG